MAKYLKIFGFSLVAIIIAIRLFGFHNTILAIQNAIGIAEQIRINNVVISRPKDWMLGHSKEETDGSVGIQLYGIIDTKEEPAYQRYYTFYRPDSENEVVSFGKLDSSTIDKIQMQLDKLERGELEESDTRRVADVLGYKAFILRMSNYSSYNVSIPSLGLNIILPSLEILNEFPIRIVNGDTQ